MDLSKAVNFVEHTLLMLKLQNLGINGASLECFKSNFSDRKQYVVIKQISETGNIIHFQSNLHLVKCGVPQGSLLGPILFLRYINKISQVNTDSNSSGLSL